MELEKNYKFLNLAADAYLERRFKEVMPKQLIIFIAINIAEKGRVCSFLADVYFSRYAGYADLENLQICRNKKKC